jgi:hypothetical protein
MDAPLMVGCFRCPDIDDPELKLGGIFKGLQKMMPH